MLSVLLRYTDSGYPFGIFKLLLLQIPLEPLFRFDLYYIYTEDKEHVLKLTTVGWTSLYHKTEKQDTPANFSHHEISVGLRSNK
jgi:hypothetical protein